MDALICFELSTLMVLARLILRPPGRPDGARTVSGHTYQRNHFNEFIRFVLCIIARPAFTKCVEIPAIRKRLWPVIKECSNRLCILCESGAAIIY